MNVKIEKLIKQFAKLPRVGNRAATRIALGLLQDKNGRIQMLADALTDAANSIHPCSCCGVLTDMDLCEYCSDITRKNGQLCIVRDLSDVLVLEKSGVFHGRYHVLGGNLSGVSGITPNDLNLDNIKSRIDNENIKEIRFIIIVCTFNLSKFGICSRFFRWKLSVHILCKRYPWTACTDE